MQPQLEHEPMEETKRRLALLLATPSSSRLLSAIVQMSRDHAHSRGLNLPLNAYLDWFVRHHLQLPAAHLLRHKLVLQAALMMLVFCQLHGQPGAQPRHRRRHQKRMGDRRRRRCKAKRRERRKKRAQNSNMTPAVAEAILSSSLDSQSPVTAAAGRQRSVCDSSDSIEFDLELEMDKFTADIERRRQEQVDMQLGSDDEWTSWPSEQQTREYNHERIAQFMAICEQRSSQATSDVENTLNELNAKADQLFPGMTAQPQRHLGRRRRQPAAQPEPEPKPKRKRKLTLAQINEELFGLDSDENNEALQWPQQKSSYDPRKFYELPELQEEESETQPEPQLVPKRTKSRTHMDYDAILKLLEDKLVELLREVSSAITAELNGQPAQPEPEPRHRHAANETWCLPCFLPYDQNGTVTVRRTREGIMSIQLDAIDTLPHPEPLRSSRYGKRPLKRQFKLQRSEDILQQSFQQSDFQEQTFQQQSFHEQSIQQETFQQQPFQEQAFLEQPYYEQSFDGQWFQEEAFNEKAFQEAAFEKQSLQAQEEQPPAKLRAWPFRQSKPMRRSSVERHVQNLKQRLTYPCTSKDALRWQVDIDEYCRQLADPHKVFDDTGNGNEDEYVQVEDVECEVDVGNVNVVDMEISPNTGTGSCSSSTDSASTLQLEISDQEYQRLLQRSRLESYQHQRKLELEDRARRIFEQRSKNVEQQPPK